MMNDKKNKSLNEQKAENNDLLTREESSAPQEIISLDIDEEGESPVDLDAETTRELLQDAQIDEYEKEIARHTENSEIQEALSERQDLNAGQEQLVDELREHHAKSPELSGGDVDAAWDDANVGEETAGGMAPTPDQDRVDEIGAAYGIDYADDEPLHTEEKLSERDQYRWELDPQSAEQPDAAENDR